MSRRSALRDLRLVRDAARQGDVELRPRAPLRGVPASASRTAIVRAWTVSRPRTYPTPIFPSTWTTQRVTVISPRPNASPVPPTRTRHQGEADLRATELEHLGAIALQRFPGKEFQLGCRRARELSQPRLPIRGRVDGACHSLQTSDLITAPIAKC